MICNPDSILLTFTDGLTDLQNIKGNYFDEEPFARIFEGGISELTVKEFNQKLMGEITSFSRGNPFPDDIAVLTCKLF